MIQGIGGGEDRADVGLLQLIQAQCRADARCIVDRGFSHAQMTDLDPLLRTDDARPFDHVAQFTDVARPAIAQQCFPGLVAEDARGTGVLLDEACQETVGQVENIFAAFA
ncbi:hypothetical protein D3C71_1079150 [compost metagenome]